jgi:Ca2+-binding EF-hand superfamily protein
MRFFTLFTLGLLIGGLPLLAAEEPVRPDSQRLFRQLDQNRDGQLESEEIAGEHARLYVRLLRTADADGDGQLSEGEFAEGLKSKRTAKPMTEKPPSRLPGADELLLLVAMADVDADGVIDPDEVPERLRPFYLRLEQRVGGGDRRQIKLREIAKAAPGLTQFALATVKRLELDVDLEFSLLPDKNWALVERLNGPRRPGEVMADVDQSLEFFRLLDTNGDGQVVYEEVPEQFTARFDRLLARADRNRDQQISEQEMRDLSNRLRALKKRDRKPKRAKTERKSKVPQESPARGE